MMLLLSIVLNLLILACILWIVGMVMEMVVSGSGLPAQVKTVVLAVIGLMGLIAILGGYRVTL